MRRDEEVMSMRQSLLERIETLESVIEDADVENFHDLIDLYRDGDLDPKTLRAKYRFDALVAIGFMMGAAAGRDKTIRELCDEEGL